MSKVLPIDLSRPIQMPVKEEDREADAAAFN
jgi:hypothetical protein